jgi:hypothetical protein
MTEFVSVDDHLCASQILIVRHGALADDDDFLTVRVVVCLNIDLAFASYFAPMSADLFGVRLVSVRLCE